MTEPEIIYALDLDDDFLAHLANPDSWIVIQGEGITSELIEDEFVAQVFEWQKRHLREHGQIATASVLENEFDDLTMAQPLTAIGDLLDRLRLRYMKNEGRKRLRKIVDAQTTDPLSVPQLFLREGRELSSLLSKRGEMFGTGDIERAMRRYATKVQQGPGSSFGFAELDDYFYGQRGLTMWLAPPKTYKSWMLIQCAMRNALLGEHVWLYSLELPAEETHMRMHCLLADVPWWRYLRNKLTTEDMKNMRRASEAIDGSGVYHIAKPEAGHRGMEEMVYKARDAGATMILFDQLQYIESAKGVSIGESNDTGVYWGVLNKARDLSDQGPIGIAHQFNRSAMHCDSMPMVEQAKGSSAIEETATLALGLWANKDMRRSGLLEVGTLIARNHMYAAWEMKVQLTEGCNFTILGRAPEDDDDE